MQPAMAPHNYMTWAIASPESTHWRPATCEEFDCQWHREGWVTLVDTTTPQGQMQADWIRRESGRRFRAEPLPAGQVRFTFEAGQTCFGHRTHKIRVDREEVFLRLGGHYQARHTDRLVHSGATPWRDEFGEHQEKLAAAIERG